MSGVLNTSIVCGIAASVIWFAHAHRPESPAPVVEEAPAIVFDEVVADLGRCSPYSGEISVVFRWTNRTGGAIRIANMKPSCGCSRATWPPEAVAPGESSVCRVHVDPASKAGRFELNASVTFDPPGPPVALRVFGWADPTVRLEPSKVDLGVFDVAGGAWETIKIFNDGQRTLDLSMAPTQADSLASSAINLEFASGAPLAPGQSDLLYIERAPGAARDVELRTEVRLIIGEQFLRIPIVGTPVSAPAYAEPDRLRFGFLTPGMEREQRVTLRSFDETPFVIDRVEAPTLPFEFRHGTQPGTEHTITAIYTGTGESGRLAGRAIVHVTCDGRAGRVPLQLSAFIEEGVSP